MSSYSNKGHHLGHDLINFDIRDMAHGKASICSSSFNTKILGKSWLSFVEPNYMIIHLFGREAYVYTCPNCSCGHWEAYRYVNMSPIVKMP